MAKRPKKVSKKQADEQQQSGGATLLIKMLCEEVHCRAFRTKTGRTYVEVEVDGHTEVWPTRSSGCRNFLRKLYYDRYGYKGIRKDSIDQVLEFLEARSLYEGYTAEVHDRIAKAGDDIYYDLVHDEWKVIHIDNKGFRVVDEAPVYFQRHRHQQSQVEPDQKAAHTFEDFFRLTTITEEDERLLLSVYIVSCFIPDIPHPLLYIFGEEGSMKSTLSRMVRKIIDPAEPCTFTLPKGIPDLVQQLAHHYFPIYENVSYISHAISDALCRAITGEGFSKRELYTNEDDLLFSYRRPVGINGIPLAVSKPDLLDRCIFFELYRIADEKRRPEREIWDEFHRILPGLLGHIFQIVSKSLTIREFVELKKLPRMADFALWGAAIAQAMGHDHYRFLNAYYQNLSQKQEELIGNNSLLFALHSFMQGRSEWEGTPAELYSQLSDEAEQMDISTYARDWPGSPAALSSRLSTYATTLKSLGISIERRKGTKGMRSITIRRHTESTASSATQSQDAAPGNGKVGGEHDGDYKEESPPVSPLKKSQGKANNEHSGEGGDVEGATR